MAFGSIWKMDSSTSIRFGVEGANSGRKKLIEFSINQATQIIEEVQDSLALWPVIAKECGVSSTSLKRIQAKFLEIRT